MIHRASYQINSDKNTPLTSKNRYRAWTGTFICLLLLLACLFPITTSAQSATNYAAVDSVKVGDTFSYAIVVETSTDYEQIVFPDTSDFGDPISIVNRKRYKVNDFADSLSYTLQFFGTQSYTIPKLPVRFISDTDTATIFVPPVPLDFKSSLQANNESLLPLKPIFNFAINWWPYLLGLIILLAIGYYAYRWYKNRDRSAKKESIPFTPQPFTDPLAELEENLQTVRSDLSILEKGDFKTFYSKLGDALRLYLERVYKIPALESTSRELLDDLRQEAAPEPIIDKMKTILREADMVKFARFSPTIDQAHRALEEAENFLEIAQHQDRQRIEYLRSQHEHNQEELKAAHESSAEDKEVSNNV